ncbi:MAG: hypothetical protein JOZ15_16700, partial [Acidobacteria bacterium]|nr:hypothetical protein [Acidobacteriota bacterium]
MNGTAPSGTLAGDARTAAPADIADAMAAQPAAPWALWRRQLAAVVRLELRKSFLGRRALGLVL